MQLRFLGSDRRLGWHLLWIVLFKAAVLYLLWSLFIQPYRVKVSQEHLDCLYSSSANCSRPMPIPLNQTISQDSKGVDHD